MTTDAIYKERGSDWLHQVSPEILTLSFRNTETEGVFLLQLFSFYAPINGMPHLAYLGQMLENEGEFGIGIFPEGVVLSRDCQNES